MSRKKKKSPWGAFVSRMFTRNRAKRDYTLPKEYLLSVADSLWRTNPSKEIIYNTLVGISSVIYSRGYQRKADDVAWFKAKRKQHLDNDFNQWLDYLDDMINSKEPITPSFDEWVKIQIALSNNSKK